jgi:hypothetical protein
MAIFTSIAVDGAEELSEFIARYLAMQVAAHITKQLHLQQRIGNWQLPN